MTEPPEKEENASGETRHKSKRPSGRWNPFASMRMTISPDERLALLKMPLPLLPPEDFLSTVEREKLARARRRPVVIGLVAFVGVAVLGALGWWLWPGVPHPDVQATAVPPSADATLAASPPSTVAPVAPVATVAQPTAESSASSRPPLPAASSPVASVPPPARPPKRDPRPSTAEKPTVLTPAPANSSSTAPHTPDFKTPW